MASFLYDIYRRIRNYLRGGEIEVIVANTSDYIIEIFYNAGQEPSTIWEDRPLWIIGEGRPGLISDGDYVTRYHTHSVPLNTPVSEIYIKSVTKRTWEKAILPVNVRPKHLNKQCRLYETRERVLDEAPIRTQDDRDLDDVE